MQDNYITATETVLLVALLVGPWIAIGIISQLALYKYRGELRKKNVILISFSLLFSSLLTVALSILVWIRFPMLAQNVLVDGGISRASFFPAIISSIVVFSLLAFVTLRLCKK